MNMYIAYSGSGLPTDGNSLSDTETSSFRTSVSDCNVCLPADR